MNDWLHTTNIGDKAVVNLTPSVSPSLYEGFVSMISHSGINVDILGLEILFVKWENVKEIKKTATDWE